MTEAYARAGVDTGEASGALAGLIGVLATIDPGRRSRSALAPGHYASVLEVAPNLGVALCTDGVGTKVIVAEQAKRFDTVGIDCVAMNVNDLVCVGAEPLALVDYLAVERADPEVLRQLAIGLKAGAEQAGVEIPGGELAQLPELIRGHPTPLGFDLVAAAIGTVALDALVTGAACAPGDAVVGLPSSGPHSNGYTLARHALLERGGLQLDERPAELGGATVADALLEPTVIYVRAVLDLLRGDVPVHGLAHITGDGVLNLLRLSGDTGFDLDAPLPVPGVFTLIAARGAIEPAEMWRVFNMGCGFCCVVARERASEAVARSGPIPSGRSGDRARDRPGRPGRAALAGADAPVDARSGERPQLAGEPALRAHAPLARQTPQLGRGARARQIAHRGDLRSGQRAEAPQRILDRRASGRAVEPGAGRLCRRAQRLVRRRRGDRVHLAARVAELEQRDPCSAGRRIAVALRHGGGALEIGAEGLDGRVRGEVHAEALELEAGHGARLRDQRVGRIELAPATGEALPQPPQVRRLDLRPLLRGGLHRHAGGIGGGRRRDQPQPRIDGHPAGLGHIEPGADLVQRGAELPRQARHHRLEHELVAQPGEQAVQRRLQAPGLRVGGIGVIGSMDGLHERKIDR